MKTREFTYWYSPKEHPNSSLGDTEARVVSVTYELSRKTFEGPDRNGY